MGILAYEYDASFVSFGEPTKSTKGESRHRGKRRHKIMEALQNRRGCCPNQEASRVRRMMPRSGAAIDGVACSPRPELPGSRPTFDERMRRTYRSTCDTFVAGCLCWRLLNPQIHSTMSALSARRLKFSNYDWIIWMDDRREPILVPISRDQPISLKTKRHAASAS